MKAEITFLPSGRKIAVRPGTTVLDAARRANVGIRTRCGGKMGCLMCKIQVESGQGLSPVKEDERLKLAGLADDGVRLACQAKLTGSAVVTVPEDPLRAAVSRLLAKQKEEEDELW